MRQGEPATSFYIVCLGHVQVAERAPGGEEMVRDYLGPGQHFGEIGLLSSLSKRVAAQLPEEEHGRRTGTCTALDHVEVVRIGMEDFRELLERHPAIARDIETGCLNLLEKNRRTRSKVDPRLGEFVRQGLFQGQDLLVLDLEKCTRCQECVKACADAHGGVTRADRPNGVTRLVLEGLRFDRFVVPSACRSCHDPVCLNGCPVDAIHRRPLRALHPGRSQHLAVVIEDWCIGCGLCADNCPFGSIHIHTLGGAGGRPVAVPEKMATNCDLCESLDGRPRCVYACPHDAAHRSRSGLDLARSLGLGLPEPAAVD